jgi:CRISPR/Cas system CMR subunit Cmr4 (Cas7 group RAMP superfamily)
MILLLERGLMVMPMKPDRIQIDYMLQFLTPFHCGTGTRVGLIDRTVARDSNDYLYVPGSTLKGVLREYCEQLSRFYVPDVQVTSPHNAGAVVRGQNQALSMVTRIFGSQYHPGHLFFDDVLQSQDDAALYNSDGKEDGRYKEIQVGINTQVRLDRLTRTAVKGALYTSEFGIRNLRFYGTIAGWLECHKCFTDEEGLADSPTYSLLLLLAGLSMIERLGGNKSTGKGQCSCEITQVKVNQTKYAKERWQSWLGHLEDTLEYYSLAEHYALTQKEVEL